MFVSWSLDQVAAVSSNFLSDLLRAIDPLATEGDTALEITDLATDSRSVSAGALFFAVPGTRQDGARFLAEAIGRGAAAVVVGADVQVSSEQVTVVRVADVRAAKAAIAARFYGYPSRDLKVVGVTGTNGKTTTCAMLRAIAEYDSGPAVSLGTIAYEIGARRERASNTTPDPITVQRYLAEGLAQGCRFAVMETSSHALSQQRVDGVEFAAAVFTNLTSEHLDYHQTMTAYRDAKARLFERLDRTAVAVLNADDPACRALRQRTRARVVTYGLARGAQVTARVRRIDIDGVSFLLRTPDGEIDINTRMLGRHNLMNAMAAATTAWALGFTAEAIRGGFQLLRGVRGRMEPIDCGQDFRVLVDYAHTDDALKNVLDNLRPLTRGRIITVFGCGGDRDRGKRARMGRVASGGSDVMVLTNDNPRSEDPLRILDEIRSGVGEGATATIEPDRRRAIEIALRAARGGDIVLIAGKGHEQEQILADAVIPFDDAQVAKEVLWSL